MKKYLQKYHSAHFLGAAIFLHVLFTLFFATVYNSYKSSDFKRFNLSSLEKQIEITPMNEELLRKYRNIGVKNGKKQFSLPVINKKTPKVTKIMKPSDSLDFSKLKFDKNIGKKINKTANEKTSAVQSVAKETTLNYKALKTAQIHRERNVNKMIKREMLQSSVSSYDQSIVKNTDLNLHFEPPEGVSESELNSVEKRHYSFRKRAYENYINGLLSTYHKFLRDKPHIARDLTVKTDLASGKVIFDKDGNIVTVKIIRWANNDSIQEIFLETLKSLTLANPPDELIGKDSNFTFYYSLQIKN